MRVLVLLGDGVEIEQQQMRESEGSCDEKGKKGRREREVTKRWRECERDTSACVSQRKMIPAVFSTICYMKERQNPT